MQIRRKTIHRGRFKSKNSYITAGYDDTDVNRKGHWGTRANIPRTPLKGIQRTDV